MSPGAGGNEEEGALAVVVPLLSVNEPEATVVSLGVADGKEVAPGEVICVLETTKATEEVVAEAPGFVAGLSAAAGSTVHAGETLCYLASTPLWVPPPGPGNAGEAVGGIPPGLRISKPALELARASGVDLGALPIGPLVTALMVRQALGQPAGDSGERQGGSFDPTAVVVVGGGGHGRTLLDLLEALAGYRVVGVLDDHLEPGTTFAGTTLLGGTDMLEELATRGVRLAVNGVGGISRVSQRVAVFERLETAGFGCPALVHPRAWVEPDATLEPGVQVLAQAYVGSRAVVGFGAVVNTAAVVSHDCRLGPYANVSPGALLAGGVTLGQATLVGMGATVNIQVAVGAGVRVGNGATVKTDVPDGAVVPAGGIWPR